MRLLKKITHYPTFIKWTNWEYLPIFIINIPTFLFWLFYALKSRRCCFFTAVNPAITTGGVLGESKIDILNSIPKEYLPKTALVKKGTSLLNIKQLLDQYKYEFPLILKPNVGERGFLVRKVYNWQEVQQYVSTNSIDFLIQEYVDYPIELSVMCYSIPENESAVTSICLKEFLHVVGDGISSVAVLMGRNKRAILQLDRMELNQADLLKSIPLKGIRIDLEPIGNHSKGTMFKNANHLIETSLSEIFLSILKKMPGINYGRFDIRCANLDTLKNGLNFKVLEFNGIAAEPAHIYDPNYPIVKKYKDIQFHWRIIYDIYKAQRTKGIKSESLRTFFKHLFAYYRYMKQTQQ